jgi:pyruvate dehydrogenase E1 component
VPYVTELLGDGAGPVIAVTDYMRAVPDQVSRWIPRPWVSLGTDGMGRSDTREALRRFFEVDGAHVVVATLAALAEAGDVEPQTVLKAAADHGIDRDIAPPWVR